MEIDFPRKHCFNDHEEIEFAACQSNEKINCQVGWQTLIEEYGARDRSLPELERAFNQNRPLIQERAATLIRLRIRARF